MKKQTMRRLSLGLALSLAVTLGTGTALAGAPDGMMQGAPPDGMTLETPPGGMEATDMSPAPTGDGVADQAAIYLENGAVVPEKEYEAGAYDAYVTTDGENATIRGLQLTSGDYGFNGIISKGGTVTLDDCDLYLTVDEPVSGDASGGAATGVDDGGTMYINNSTLTVDGSARYVVSAYNDATLVVNDSTVTSTGKSENTLEIAEPFSNEALLISGNARANFSVGATKTYYFNSKCVAEGWAALSTDSATGNGLDLYAYNTEAVTQNGGYATYADTNCRVWLYGSDLQAAEIGAIISKSGQILVADSIETPAEVLAYNNGETVEQGSVLAGGRNAVMIHAPDMMGVGVSAADCGTLTVRNSTLLTSRDLVSTKDYHDYSDAVAAYVDYISGADILVRSTSANITLDNAQLDSYSGVLVLTALSSDSMGNFLGEGDGWNVEPVAITMENMTADGNILHMDYQRRMTLTLDNATLTGKVISGTVTDWNALWTAYDKEDCNWLVDDDFASYYGVELTLQNGAVWNVTAQSSLSSLTVAEGATVNGVLIQDGQVVAIEPGKTYTGRLVVLPAEPTEEQLEAINSDSAPMTRAAFAAALASIMTENVPEAEPAFADTANCTASDSIAYLADKGIVSGNENAMFRPNDSITTIQAAKMVLGAQGVTGLTGAGWKEATKQAAVAAGILTEDADLSAILTRAEAAKLLAAAKG
jgi:hypothetical protein